MPHQCTDCGRRFDDGSKEMLSGCPDCGGNKFQFMPDGSASGGTDATTAQSADLQTERPPTGPSRSSVARTVGNAATAVRDLVGNSSTPEKPTRGENRTSPAGDHTATDTATKPTARTQPDTAPESESTAGPEPAEPRTSAESGSPSQSREQPGRSESVPQTGHNRPTERDVGSEPVAASMGESEDAAQASARSELVSPDELPSEPTTQSGWERTTPGPRTPNQSEKSTRSGGQTEPEEETTEGSADRPDLSELRAELNQQFESIRVVEPGQYELNLMELFDREEYIVALQEDGKYTVQVPERWQE